MGVLDKLQERHGLTDYERDLVRKLRRARPVLSTILRHVSRSGMTRHIDVYWTRSNREQVYLTPLVAKMCGYSRHKGHGPLVVGGCGMDMGFAVVYDFGSAVFPVGFKYRAGEHHRNGDPAPRDRDGGYSFKQEWL